MSYVIFITLIAIVIAPALFALSYNLMLIMQSLGERLSSSGAQSLVAGLNFGGKGVNPLDYKNKLIFANGPLTGTSIPCTGRNSIGAKSPLTGGFGESEVGGYWGA